MIHQYDYYYDYSQVMMTYGTGLETTFRISLEVTKVVPQFGPFYS